MFAYQGPVHAQQALRTFMRTHGNTMPAGLAEKLDAAANEPSPVPTCVYGMEWLYAALSASPAVVPADVREQTVEMLGTLATVVAQNQFYSKGERAWLVSAWAANELTPTLVDTPVPEVDPAFALVSDPG